MRFHSQSLHITKHRPGTHPHHPPGFSVPEDPVRHGILRSPDVFSQGQRKIRIDRDKLLVPFLGSSCTISGVPGWMQPEAGSVCTAGTEVPFCLWYVIRCTVNPVKPSSGSVRAGLISIAKLTPFCFMRINR